MAPRDVVVWPEGRLDAVNPEATYHTPADLLAEIDQLRAENADLKAERAALRYALADWLDHNLRPAITVLNGAARMAELSIQALGGDPDHDEEGGR